MRVFIGAIAGSLALLSAAVSAKRLLIVSEKVSAGNAEAQCYHSVNGALARIHVKNGEQEMVANALREMGIDEAWIYSVDNSKAAHTSLGLVVRDNNTVESIDMRTPEHVTKFKCAVVCEVNSNTSGSRRRSHRQLNYVPDRTHEIHSVRSSRPSTLAPLSALLQRNKRSAAYPEKRRHHSHHRRDFEFEGSVDRLDALSRFSSDDSRSDALFNSSSNSSLSGSTDDSSTSGSSTSGSSTSGSSASSWSSDSDSDSDSDSSSHKKRCHRKSHKKHHGKKYKFAPVCPVSTV